MSIWSQYGQDTQNKLMFSRFVDQSIGDDLEKTIAGSINKKESGGAQLQYMAYTNADLLGIAPKDLKNNPEKAMRLAITRNLGEIAYQEYNNAIKSGVDQKTALSGIDTMMKNMIPEFEKDPAMFIRGFAQSDKDGEAYVMFGQKKYATSMTGYDLGSKSTAFLERMADTTILGRWLSNTVNGEPLSFRQSLKGAALIDNLYGADPMLSKGLLAAADVTGFAAGIAETMAVSYLTGGAGTATMVSRLAIPVYQTVKGVQQSYTNAYGLRADPTVGELAAESVFDFASTYIGMRYGQRIVDTATGLSLAPKIGQTVNGLSKTGLFNSYVRIGVAGALLNPAFDMAVDYGTANAIEAVGIALPENTAMMYNQLGPEDLLKAYGKRVMMSFGAAAGRRMKDAVFAKEQQNDQPLFGSRAYTDREFKDLLQNEGMSPMAYNFGKYVAATGYMMSPGVLSQVDNMIRQNPNLVDPNESSPSLIKAILDAGTPDGNNAAANYRPIIIANILQLTKSQNQAYTDMTDLNQYSVSTRGVAKILFGMTDEDMRTGIKSMNNQLGSVINIGNVINDNQDRLKAVVNNQNVAQISDDIRDLVINMANSVTPENRDAVVKDIAHLLNNTIISAKDFDHADRLKEDVLSSITREIDARINNNAPDNQIKSAQTAVDLANRVFSSLSDNERFEDTTYNTATDSYKDAFIQKMFDNYEIHDPNDNIKTANNIYENTRKVANEFAQHNTEMANLKNNPLSKHNSSIQSLMETGVMDRAIADLDTALGQTKANPNLTRLNGFLGLKKAVVTAAEVNLTKYAESVVAVTKNKSIPDNAKHAALNETMQKFYLLMNIMGGSMDSQTRTNIDSIMSRIDSDVYDNKMLDIFEGSKSSIRDVYKNIVEYNAMLTVSRNIVVDLANKMAQKMGPYKQPVSMVHSRIQHLFPGLSAGDLRRIINAMSINGATLDTRLADTGEFLDHDYTIVTSSGDTVSAKYSDADIANIVETVLGKVGTDDKIVIADGDSEVTNLAAMAAQRILDQELLLSPRQTNAQGIQQPYTDQQRDLAIANANSRLRALTGSDDIVIQSVKLSDQNEMRDHLTIQINVPKLKSEKGYDKFISNYFTVTQPPNIGANLKLDNPFVDRIRNRANMPNLMISDKDGTIRSLPVKSVVDEYNLFKTSSSVSTVVDATYLSSQYGFRDNDNVLRMVVNQMILDSPKLYRDLLRTASIQNPGISSSNAETFARSALTNIAAEEIHRTSIQVKAPVSTDFEFLLRARAVESVRQKFSGVDIVPARFGRYMMVNVSHNGADMSSDEIEKLDFALTNDCKMERVGASGAGHGSMYVLTPSYKGTTEAEQRELVMSAFDDYVGLGSSVGPGNGKVHFYYNYNDRTNEIQFNMNRPDNTWQPIDALNYEDVMGAVRSGFNQHISRLNKSRDMELALLSLAANIYEKLPDIAPDLQEPNRPVYGRDYQTYYDHWKDRFAGATEQQIYDNLMDDLPTIGKDFSTKIAEEIAKKHANSPTGIIETLAELLPRIRNILAAGEEAEDTLNKTTGYLTSILVGLSSDIEKQRTMLRAISDITSQKVVMDNAPSTTIQDLNASTIYDAVKKALSTEVRAQPMKQIRDQAEVMTDKDISHQLVLALMTRSAYFGFANQEEGVKRMNAVQLRSSISQAGAENIYNQYAPYLPQGSNGRVTIYLDGSPKTQAGGSIRDDGVTELPSILMESICREITGSPYSGQKLVITYGGSNIKTQAATSKDGRIKMSVHNFKALGPMFIRKFFPNGVISDSITLSRDEFIHFIASFAVHSTQQTASINSEPNRQQVINPYVGSLYNLVIDSAGLQRKIEATYGSAEERANGIVSNFRNSGRTGKGQIVPIQSNKPVELSTFGDGHITMIRNEERSGNARYFGNNLTGENARYNVFSTTRITFDDDVQKVSEPGLTSAIEIGIRNLYDMARSYYDSQQSAQKPENVTRALTEIAQHIEQRGFDPNGNYANLPKQLFDEHSETLLSYLSDMGHLTKLVIKEGGKDVPLYFANFERNGLDGPHHSGPVIISAVRNMAMGYHFAGNAVWSRHQDADFDGDQAVWRAIDKEGVKQYIEVARGESPASDSDIIRNLAVLDRDARYETHMLIDSSFESEESKERLRAQPSQFQQIFGLLFATQFNKALPGLDILEKTGIDGDLESRLKSAISENLKQGENIQLELGPLENTVVKVDSGFNPFQRNGYRRLVLANNKEQDQIFSNHYLGAMNMSNYFRKGDLTAIMNGKLGLEKMGDISVAVTTNPSGKTFFILENDGKAMFSKVIAAVKRINEKDDVTMTDDEVIKSLLTAMYTPNKDAIINSEDNNRISKYAKRLISNNNQVYDETIIRNMRAGQPDEGIIKQFSSAGANAFKNVFQERFHAAYTVNGKLDSNAMTEDMNAAFARARIASNILIDDLDVFGNHTYRTFSNLDKTHSNSMSKAIPGIINQMAKEAMDKVSQPMDILNAAFNGNLHTKDFTDQEIENAIRFFRKGDPAKRSHQVRKLFALMDEQKIQNFDMRDPSLRSHISLEVYRTIVGDNIPFYTKSQFQLDDRLMKINKVMGMIDQFYQSPTVKGRLLEVANDMATSPVLLNLRKIAGDKAITNKTDLVANIMAEMKGFSAAMQLSESEVLRILNDLGIDVSKEKKTIVTSLGDPKQTGFMNFETLQRVTRTFKSTLKAALTKDRVGNYSALMLNGKEATTDQLIRTLNGEMMKPENQARQPVLRQVITGLFKSMQENGQLLFLMGTEGMNAKTARSLNKILGGTTSWNLNDPQKILDAKDIDMFSLEEGGRLLSPVETDDIKRTLIDSRTGRRIAEIGLSCI